jgi:hypothetical protein
MTTSHTASLLSIGDEKLVVNDPAEMCGAGRCWTKRARGSARLTTC